MYTSDSTYGTKRIPRTIERPSERVATTRDGHVAGERDASRRITGNLCAYVGATAFFAAFGAIYEVFSHEVYSYFMIYAFAIPLLAGVVPFLLALRRGWSIPSQSVTQLYGAGVVTLAVGSVMRGVLDIYGTTNVKAVMLPVLGIAMVSAALVRGALESRR